MCTLVILRRPEHRWSDQLRLGEYQQRHVADAVSGHLHPDRRLGQCHPYLPAGYLHHPRRRLQLVEQRFRIGTIEHQGDGFGDSDQPAQEARVAGLRLFA